MDDQSRIISAEAAIHSLLEPPRRRFFSRWRKAQPPPLPFCENCGAELHGEFCSQCGQHAVDYRRSIWRLLVDAADSFLNWDSKFFSTLALLIARPGYLTRQFIAGRRVAYLHPLRLYLLVSVIFFLAVQFARPTRNAAGTSEGVHLELGNEKIPIFTSDQPEESTPRPNPSAIPASPDALKNEATTSSSVVPRPKASPKKKNREEPQTDFEKWINRRAKEKLGENGSRAQQFIAGVMDHLGTMMLFCIPLFALVLKMLYLRQKRYYIDHLIYALHIHSFFYLAVLVTVGASLLAGTYFPRAKSEIVWTLVLAATAYVLLSIRRVYRQGWIGTVLKLLVGGAIYFFVIILAFAATILVTLLLP